MKGPRPRPPIARFLGMVSLTAGPTDCQEWTGSRWHGGYGKFWDGQRFIGAHRWILGYLRGRPLGPGERGLHQCDNPPCVNPLHLYVGTQKQNIADAIARGRWPTYRARGATRARCGTLSGYCRHIRRHEPSCQKCRDARNAHQAAYRARRRGAI